MHIDHTLVLSAAHLQPSTAATLNAQKPFASDLAWAPFATYDEGWIWYVPINVDDEIVDYPPELSTMFALARAHNCRYLRLDCDASPWKGLPTYEW